MRFISFSNITLLEMDYCNIKGCEIGISSSLHVDSLIICHTTPQLVSQFSELSLFSLYNCSHTFLTPGTDTIRTCNFVVALSLQLSLVNRGGGGMFSVA